MARFREKRRALPTYLMALGLGATSLPSYAQDRLLGIQPVEGEFSPSHNDDPESPERLIELERSIWYGPDKLVPEMEEEVVYLLQRKPDSPFYHYLMLQVSLRLLGQSPTNTRLLKQSAILAQQAFDLDEKAEWGYLAIGELLDIMGRKEKAVSLLQEIRTSGQKTSWRVDFAMARFSSERTPPASTLANLRLVLRRPDADQSIVIPYAASLMRTELARNRIIPLESWTKEFSHPALLHISASKFARDQDYQSAREVYLKIIREHPDNMLARFNHGVLLYRELSDPLEAIAEFDAISKAPDGIPEGGRSLYFAHRATMEMRLERKEEAMKSFVEALRATSDQAAMIRFIDAAYTNDERTEDLAELFDFINTEIPGNAAFHAYLGKIYSDRLGQHRQSIGHFADAIVLDPTRSEYYNAMGLAYYHLEDLRESLKLFTAATNSDPTDATAQYNKACAHALLGNSEKSLAALRIALRLDPSLRSHARDDKDFASLRAQTEFRKMTEEAGVAALAH